MRRHSFLRLGSYTEPDTTPANETIVISPNTDSVWTAANDAVTANNLVYISDSNVVALANGSAEETMTGIGFVKSRSGSSVTVQSSGELSGFTGLLPGKTYFAGKTAGSIWALTEEDPSFPLVVQVVGKAKTSSVLFISINPGPYILSA